MRSISPRWLAVALALAAWAAWSIVNDAQAAAAASALLESMARVPDVA